MIYIQEKLVYDSNFRNGNVATAIVFRGVNSRLENGRGFIYVRFHLFDSTV